jgi:hypothetical protein
MGTSEISLILSGGAVAASIGAVIITYRLGRQRFEHEHRLSDLDTARRVLDDAASAMQRAYSEIGSITTHLDAFQDVPEGRLWDHRLLRGDLETLENAREELDSIAGRLRIRFGSEHELIAVFEGAATKALEVAYRLELIGAESQSPGDTVDGEREQIERTAREFGIARDSFTLVAYRVAGVKLPPLQLAEINEALGDKSLLTAI